MQRRTWDIPEWFSDQTKTAEILYWRARTDFKEGLRQTGDWYRHLEDGDRYYRSSKQFGLDSKRSISAVVACYKDGGRCGASRPSAWAPGEVLVAS
jgi:hypothetical protein